MGRFVRRNKTRGVPDATQHQKRPGEGRASIVLFLQSENYDAIGKPTRAALLTRRSATANPTSRLETKYMNITNNLRRNIGCAQ